MTSNPDPSTASPPEPPSAATAKRSPDKKSASPVASGSSPRAAAVAQADTAGEIEADEDLGVARQGGSDDDDDGYESTSSSSTSLASSVRDYNFENNRRYHKYKEGQYVFPNDDIEQEREDMRHAMLVHLCGGRLHYAPLDHPHKILDIGTGTGIWAIDMADEYPEAEVVGIDLSPIQPSWVPPNVRFLVDDAEAVWADKPNSLDYVHLRNMSTAVKDWPRLMQQALNVLKPGGWLEIQDLNFTYRCDDGTMPPDYGPTQMLDYMHQAMTVFGVDLDASVRNADRIADAGFANINHKILKVPVGPWPRDRTMKTIGIYNRGAIYDGLQGITLGPYTRALHWTPEQVEAFLVKVRKDYMNPSIHSYINFHLLWGQKAANSTS